MCCIGSHHYRVPVFFCLFSDVLGIASGWDDPRMPTLNGLRRRGYSAKTLNTFCDVIGVARRGGEVWTAVNVLEQCCREELDAEAQRRFVVVDPVKVTLTNVAVDFVEHVMLPNNPRDESAGKRPVALCNTLYLERSDFREDGAGDRDFFGLAPGKTVMLRCERAESFGFCGCFCLHLIIHLRLLCCKSSVLL